MTHYGIICLHTYTAGKQHLIQFHVSEQACFTLVGVDDLLQIEFIPESKNKQGTSCILSVDNRTPNPESAQEKCNQPSTAKIVRQVTHQIQQAIPR